MKKITVDRIIPDTKLLYQIEAETNTFTYIPNMIYFYFLFLGVKMERPVLPAHSVLDILPLPYIVITIRYFKWFNNWWTYYIIFIQIFNDVNNIYLNIHI